ncbi:hypothetical protein Tco_0592945 [Tanacetum coccineum]
MVDGEDVEASIPEIYALETFEEEQQNKLHSLLADIILPQMHDRWYCSLEAMGEFSVKSVRNLVDDYLLFVDDVPT